MRPLCTEAVLHTRSTFPSNHKVTFHSNRDFLQPLEIVVIVVVVVVIVVVVLSASSSSWSS